VKGKLTTKLEIFESNLCIRAFGAVFKGRHKEAGFVLAIKEVSFFNIYNRTSLSIQYLTLA